MKKRLFQAASVLAVIIVMWWGYSQWRLLDNLIHEKGNDLKEYYFGQGMYLESLVDTADRILISGNPLKMHRESFKRPSEVMNQYIRNQSLSGYGAGRQVNVQNLRNFMHFTSNSFYNMSSVEEIDEDALEYVKRVRDKAVELLSIHREYSYKIDNLNGKQFYYSPLWVEAINKMDKTLEEHPFITYEYSMKEESDSNMQRPSLKEVFGEKEYSDEEALEEARKFVEGIDSITHENPIGWGKANYNGVEMLESVTFGTENGYEIEVYKRGPKVASFRERDFIYEHDKPYKKPVINITEEEAVQKLTEFLKGKGFSSLVLEGSVMTDRHLTVTLIEAKDVYLNSAAHINAVLDLTDKGRVLALILSRYWEGLAFDDSGKEEASGAYGRAKAALKPGIVVKEERLVGRPGSNGALDFYWRFTVEYDGEDFYVYIEPETGEEKDIVKVYRRE